MLSAPSSQFVQTTVIMLGTLSSQDSLKWLQVFNFEVACAALADAAACIRFLIVPAAAPVPCFSLRFASRCVLQPHDSTAPVCFAPLNPYEKITLSALIPFIMALELIATMLGHMAYVSWKNRSAGEQQAFDFDPYLRTFCALFIFSES